LTIKISISRTIRANREFVFDWWTDLSPDDAKLIRPLKARRILSKTKEKIVLHDEEQMYFKRMEFDVEVTLHRPDSWISEYRGRSATARSEYFLESGPNGSTILKYSTRIEPKGFLTRTFAPLVKPFVKRIFASEMDTFVTVLEKDYRARETG